MSAIKTTAVKTDFIAKARAAWGEALPDWVIVLAEEVNRSSGAAVAKRLGYSGSLVSGVLSATYAGDFGNVEAKVRGALMGAQVRCPVLGEIGRDQCLDEQKMRSVGSSSLRARIYRACRAGCEHSRIRNAEASDA